MGWLAHPPASRGGGVTGYVKGLGFGPNLASASKFGQTSS